MIKKIVLFLMTLLCLNQVFAIDKNQIDLNNNFWGTWQITNEKAQCTENYQFKKPGNFEYSAQQKQLSGDFSILRNQDVKYLDILNLDIQKDNGLTGCAGDSNNYGGKQSQFLLKWVSPTSAEICIDNLGKECTGLYLNKR